MFDHSSRSSMTDTANGPQRARGHVAIGFEAHGLARLSQAGCGRVLLPKTYAGAKLAVLLNTAGGLTGGDRFSVRAEAGPKAGLAISTQAAERIYRAPEGRAEVENRLFVAPGATLHWLPQETILFQDSALARRLEVDMAPDSRFLGMEMLVMGRAAMGESVTRGLLSEQWRIRRGGRLVHAEAVRMEGDLAHVAQDPALLAQARAMAVMVLVAPEAEDLLPALRRALPNGEIRAAASAWAGKLVLRALAPDLAPLKAALAGLLKSVPGVQVPHVWQY